MVREGEAEKGPRVLRNRDADFLSTAEMQEEQEAPVPHAFQGKSVAVLCAQKSVPADAGHMHCPGVGRAGLHGK